MPGRYLSLLERFFLAVKKGEGFGACWLWQGAKGTGGYGKIWVDGKEERAHRVAYKLAHGELADDAVICHRCDNPPCVRPSHLFAGTHSDNVLDKVRKGRQRNGMVAGMRAGEKHHMARLVESEVRAIRQRRDQGETATALAKEYGVSVSAITAIHRRRLWRHVV